MYSQCHHDDDKEEDHLVGEINENWTRLLSRHSIDQEKGEEKCDLRDDEKYDVSQGDDIDGEIEERKNHQIAILQSSLASKNFNLI